ncbi:MAG: response regulator [Anaerolineales bacterium]|nr:response regulator [Anaerolineales bacterium]
MNPQNPPYGEALVILLIEDNPAHAELIRRNFETHRIANRLIHVTDGEMALDYLFRRGAYADSTRSPRPHLILLDLRLPKIDGLDVLKTIKASQDLRAIPVVVLTTSEAEQDALRAYQQHANSYLVKPVDFHQFTQLMEELGVYWLVWNYYSWP